MTTATIENPKPASHGTHRWSRKDVIVAAAITIGCLPMLPLHLKHSWERPQYQYFPVVLCVAAWLIWTRWSSTAANDNTRTLKRLQILFMLAVAGLLVCATLLFSPWLSAIAAVLVTACLMMQFGGAAVWPRLLPAWALLWFAVRLPQSLDTMLRGKLQLLTSKASSLTLDLFGFDHLMEGTVLDFPKQRLFVDEACSGVQSLFAMLAFTAMYAVWARRPAIVAGLLMLSAVFWTGVMNIVRVSSIAVAFQQWEVDLSSGWQHETLGMALFAVSLTMIASTDRLLRFLFDPIDDEDNPLSQFWDGLVTAPHWNRENTNTDARIVSGSQPKPKKREVPPKRANRGPFHSQSLAAVFLVLGAGQAMLLMKPNVWAGAAAADAVAKPIDKDFLAQEYGHWKLAGFRKEQRDADNNQGEFSKVWTYRSSEYAVIVSFDYPFGGWHDLTECYRNIGWVITDKTIRRRDPAKSSPDGWEFVSADMAKPTGEYGLVLFSLFHESGDAIKPKTNLSVGAFADRLGRGLASELVWNDRGKRADAETNCFQVQVFVTSDYRLPKDDQTRIRERFFELRERFRKQWQTDATAK